MPERLFVVPAASCNSGMKITPSCIEIRIMTVIHVGQDLLSNLRNHAHNMAHKGGSGGRF
jgi:hypothetical protein